MTQTQTQTQAAVEVKMVKEKDCKGSVRYQAVQQEGPPPPISTLYVNRTAFDKMPDKITVQLRAE